MACFLLPVASVVSALALIGLACYFAWRRERLELPLPIKSWTLLMASVALSAATSIAPGISWISLLLFGGYFSVIYVLGIMLDEPHRVWGLCRNLFWTTVGCAVLGIVLSLGHIYWTYAWGGLEIRAGFPDHRAASIFFHPNIFSAYLVLAAGLGLMLLVAERGRVRIAVAAGLFVTLIAQVLTSSRSGWIATLVQLVLIGLLVDRRILIALFGGSLFALVSFWQLILPRLHTLAEADFGSNLHRVMVWQSALAMIAQRPLTGWGPGSWPIVYPRFENPGIVEKLPHAHNLYLMIGAEYGLITLFVLMGVFLSLVVKAFRDTHGTPWSRHVRILGGTIAGYLVLGLFDFIFTEGRNSILFFSLLGMLVAMRRFRPQPRREIRRVLFVSNGYGEDRIAASIARRWPRQGWELFAFPLVGEGLGYRGSGARILAPTQAMPSGGFILRSARAFGKDLASGLAVLFARQLLAMRELRGEMDLVIAVGDLLPLYFAWLSSAPFAFVGCAKSDYYLRARHDSLDRWFMGHPRCLAVCPRDGLSARNLAARGLPALDLGNPMMDDLEPTGPAWPAETSAVPIGILPGSRDEAYRNFVQLLACCVTVARRAPAQRPAAFYAAIAESLDLRRLADVAAEVGWTLDASERYLVGPQGVSVHLHRGHFGTWLHHVRLVIGMAGTANEQAVGVGLPVVTFPGPGPQFNAAFATAQTQLLGDSISLVGPDPEAVAREVWALLGDEERLARLRALGQARMGPPGASGRIVAHLIELLEPCLETREPAITG